MKLIINKLGTISLAFEFQLVYQIFLYIGTTNLSKTCQDEDKRNITIEGGGSSV